MLDAFRRLRLRLRDPLLTALTVVVLVLLFAVAPLRAMGVVGTEHFQVAFLGLLAVVLFIVSDSVLAVASIVACIAMAVFAAFLRLHQQAVADFWLAAAWLTLGLTLSVVVAHAVYAPGKVTYHRIVGAMLLYLNIGVIFVALYFFLILSDPHALRGVPAVRHDFVVVANLIYFSFVTLTSVGYGDIVPLHPLARSLANIEALIGQLFPATVLARLLTLRIEHKPEP